MERSTPAVANGGVPTTATRVPRGPASGARLAGIDGLRAVAALWVVLFHMRAFSGGSLWPGVDLIVRSGSTGVSLFLVLSGLCLYLPFAGGRQSRFSTDSFFRRRIRRLFPAYFASLAIIIVAHIVADGRLGLPRYSSQEMVVQTATHATLTHQFFPETFYGLNGAYWSLGLEWELYLTLPLLIAASVKWGLTRTVIVVFAATALYRLALFGAGVNEWIDPEGVWATVVLPNFFLGRWSEFALGMVAAEVYRTRGFNVGWRLLSVAAVSIGLGLAFPGNPLNHLLYGVVFFTLTALVLSGDNIVARTFSWRPLVAIGVMSYSLYLVHQPIIEVMGYALGAGRGSDPRQVFLLMMLLFPIVLLAGVLLFAFAERRSLSGAASRLPVRELLFPTSRAARSGAPDPAARAPEARVQKRPEGKQQS